MLIYLYLPFEFDNFGIVYDICIICIDCSRCWFGFAVSFDLLIFICNLYLIFIIYLICSNLICCCSCSICRCCICIYLQFLILIVLFDFVIYFVNLPLIGIFDCRGAGVRSGAPGLSGLQVVQSGTIVLFIVLICICNCKFDMYRYYLLFRWYIIYLLNLFDFDLASGRQDRPDQAQVRRPSGFHHHRRLYRLRQTVSCQACPGPACPCWAVQGPVLSRPVPSGHQTVPGRDRSGRTSSGLQGLYWFDIVAVWIYLPLIWYWICRFEYEFIDIYRTVYPSNCVIPIFWRHIRRS